MEFLKILVFCVGLACLYGILHDLVTAHVCLEYFTVFHPPNFPGRGALGQALGWGILATWWVGAGLGLLWGTAARLGRNNKWTVRNLLPLPLRFFVILYLLSMSAGLIGFFLAESVAFSPPHWVAVRLPEERHARFLFNWWAHSAAYLLGAVGGLVMVFVIWRGRRKSVPRSPSP